MAGLEPVEPGESNFTRPNLNTPGYTNLETLKTPPLVDQIDVYRRGILSTDTHLSSLASTGRRIYLHPRESMLSKNCTGKVYRKSLPLGLASGNFPSLALYELTISG